MKKTVNRFFSMLLVLSMVIGMFAMPAMAVPAQAQTGSGETGEQTGEVAQSQGTEEDGSAQESGSKITFTDEVIFNNQTLKVDLNGDVQADGTQIDYDDPAIILVESELKTMKVLGADGEQVGLTQEQIGTVLYLYQQYLDHWTANANVLGVQVPFFLAYNDNGEDGLGVLGEMLALANVPVDAIRSGDYTYDDLVGMIQNFTYGDVLGVNFYGEAIAAARDEVLALVEASGAKTNAQKLLVINDWLAHVNTFDMPYIMNADKAEGEKPMIAETPVKHERYDDVYNVIFEDYKPQIAQQFHDPIYAEVVASMRQTFYEEAIRAAIRQQAVEMGITEASKQEAFVNAAMEQYRQEQYEAALEAEQQKVYDEAYAEAYDEYLWENCEHTFELVTMHWTAKADGGYDAIADVRCANCEITVEGIEATVSKDNAQSVAATCTEDGADVYIALAKIIDSGNVILGTVTDTKTDVVPAAGHDYVDGICSVCGEADPDYVAPTEPSEETTEPSEEPTEPSEEVTEPSEEVTEPSEDPTEPSEEVTEPSEEVTEPAGEGSGEAETLNADADLEAAAAAAADTAAAAAVEAAAADIEAAANAAADAAVAALTDDEKYALARPLVEANADVMAQIESEADAAAENFMTENADAIAADALGFITATFGEEAAAQFEAQCDAFIETAETEGVEVAEGVVMTIEDMVQNTMANEAVINLGTEEEPYMVTPNEAVEIYADQAAVGLTGGVINYWEGSHFGALGFGTSVCLGYSKAFTYLVQCLFPEVYGVNGADTDLSVSENWKTREELYYDENGELDLDAGYVVDLVRITFDASVTMFGETEDNFNSDHFWNAVKLDGKWYYIDPCYTDVFTEVMMRERVETDGSMNHLYFLISHPSCEELYEGNYKEIKTMYADLAVHTDYEDSWISRIKSNVYSDGTYFYYLYDSTDMLTMMEEYENSQENQEQMEEETILYRIVRHKIDTDDLQDGDSDFEPIINFNYYETEDAEPYALVYNPKIRAMEDSDYIGELFQEHQAIEERYPALAITMGIRDDKMYFNLSTKLLCYDMTTGEITVVKEYTDVYAVRDDTNPFGGMAFTVTNNAEEADLYVNDHPIAGVTVKPDGKLYVSVATNFAFISGKDPFDIADQSSYGYEFEESNYNPDYSSYNDYGDYTDEELESYGYEKEINDNDEFMWTANFVDILELDHLEGTEHTYEAVTVAPHCDRDGFTENRCTTCGAIEDGSRVWDEGTAVEHHYINFQEMYYGKDDAGRRLTGECYVCTICGDAVEEPTESSSDDSLGGMFGDSTEDNYEEEKAAYDEIVANAGHDYVPTDATWSDDSTSVTFSHLECSSVCMDVKPYRDCLVEDETISVDLSSTVTASASVTEYEGDCTSDLIAIYTATGTADGYEYTASNRVAVAPGSHAYEATFTWNGTESATADLVCGVCGDTRTGVSATITYDSKNSVAATCQATGNDVYVANVVVKDGSGNEIGSATDTKNVELAIVDHKYVNNECNMCGKILLETPVIEYCYSKSQTSVRVNWNAVEGADGYQLMRSTTPEDEDSWTSAKTITNGSTTYYTNQGLTVGQTYYYRVRAYANHPNSGKVWSSLSDVGYMPAAVVFADPYSNSDYRIRVRWEEVDGANGYQIWRKDAENGYRIVKTIGDKGNELTSDQGHVTAYGNTGLTAGEKYTYKMRAFYIKDGNKVFGTFSDEVTVAVQPSKPTITLSTPRAGRVMVSWNDFEKADGFQVWMAESAGGSFRIVRTVDDGTATSYTKYELESGKTYYFKVRAYMDVDGKKTFGAYSTTMSIRVS